MPPSSGAHPARPGGVPARSTSLKLCPEAAPKVLGRNTLIFTVLKDEHRQGVSRVRPAAPRTTEFSGR